MMKSKHSFFIKSVIIACLFMAGMAVTACNHAEPSYPNDDNSLGELDGLWVEQVKSGSTIVPHLDINGNSVILCKSKPLECDYSDRVNGTLQYSVGAKKGTISFKDGSSLEFLCDEQGNICTRDTIPYYKIDNTLDKLQEQLNYSPKFILNADYVGPDHDLGIDLSCKTLLEASELEAGGAWYIDMLKFAGESLAKGAISWAGGKGLEVIVSCFYTDPTSKTLEKILSQVDAINGKLYEIENLIKMENYETYINSRTNDYCSPLTNYSKPYADAMLEVDKSDSVAIANIVNAWHDDSPTISGKLGGPMQAASNYMDFLMNTLVEQTNVYAIYDIYTFNCVPWAKQGYEFRQSLRACDLALINANVQMAMMYASIHHWEAEGSIYKTYVTDLNDKVQRFVKFCENNCVDVSDNVICQIKGAHFEMKKDLILRDYNIPPMTWYTTGSRFYHDESTTSDLVYFGGMGMSIQQFKQKQITPDELTAMVNYYANSPKVSVQEMLRQGGATIRGDLLLLNDETTVDWDDRLHVHLVQLNHEGNWRYPRESAWLSAKTHWSWFAYYFDGWIYHEAYGAATDIVNRY